MRYILRLQSCFRQLSMARAASTREYSWKEVTIPVPWGHISGKSWGDEVSEQKILCIHGWLDNAGSFDRLIPLLPPGFHLVALDMPGHGLSSHRPPGVSYHFVDYVTDVKRVVDDLKWNKFSFLCHSMGAAVATTFAAVFPEMIERMALLEGLVPMSRSAEEIPDIMRQAVLQGFEQEGKQNKVYPTVTDVIDRIMEGNPELTEEAARVLAIRGTRQTSDGSYEFARDIRHKLPSMLRMTREIVSNFVARVQAPTVVIFAEESYLRSVSQKQAGNFSNSNIMMCSVKGNHHVHLNDPKKVAGIASEFLLHQTCSVQYTLLGNM